MSDAPLDLNDGRFARLEAIEWWDQKRVASARIFVAGAGALGNEVLKNLALLGVGHVVVADMDHIELSNLSRSVLFRAADEGKLKAECAARGARDIYPDMEITPLSGNLLAEVGLGWINWADVVIGALDNREARVFLNQACAQLGKPWVDGGIEVLQGIMRVFGPPEHACYECTMGKVDWDLLNKRRSCSILARRAIQERGTPTTSTTASIIAAMQVQEAIKLLHGNTDFLGRGFFYDGVRHDSYAITLPIKPDCDWHGEPDPVVRDPALNAQTTVVELLARAERELGGLTDITLSRELVGRLVCGSCESSRDVFRPAIVVREEEAWCEDCQQERSPTPLHSLRPGSELGHMTLGELGLPAWDIVWARHGGDFVGLEISGDCPLPIAHTPSESTV